MERYMFQPESIFDHNVTEVKKFIVVFRQQCIDTGVKYKSKPSGKLQKINDVETADLCREICSETDGCLYWTWIEKARKKVCRLKSNVINTGFRRQKKQCCVRHYAEWM